MELSLTPAEEKAVQELAERQEMTPQQAIRQALRLYQAVVFGHIKIELPPLNKLPPGWTAEDVERARHHHAESGVDVSGLD